MYYIACIVASLVLSFDSSAQEFAAEPAIASAAVILKLALPTQASRLTILSADRATWREGEAEMAVVERRLSRLVLPGCASTSIGLASQSSTLAAGNPVVSA